jgi:repressor LexA
MQGLTERQRQILEFITKRIGVQGYPPTIREIGEEMGIRSTNGVNDHLKALERKGYLKREVLKSRALRPVEHVVYDEGEAPASLPMNGNGHANGTNDDREASNVLATIVPMSSQTIAVPVLGRVAAGTPILADEHVETTVHVDSFFLGTNKTDRVFALRVTGESMIDAGIFDGDYIFVKKQIEARNGDIVVAMIDGEATVKRFEPAGDVIRFLPENKTMKPIVVRREEFRSTSILGIVCGVYRRM